METRNVAFLSDDWYIDGETAWFLYSNVGALLKYNFVTGKCEFVSIIPNEENCSFRQYIKCIKTGDDIIVLPDYGHFILFYCNYSAPRLGYINFWSKQRKYNFCFIIALLRKVDNFSM